VIATGFLADSENDWLAGRDRQETARFPRASSSNPADPPRLPSHTFCVGTLDLASVSMTVRSISNSVRRTHSPVSTNVRQKTPLIARQAVYDCAPLHVAVGRGTAPGSDRQDVDQRIGKIGAWRVGLPICMVDPQHYCPAAPRWGPVSRRNLAGIDRAGPAHARPALRSSPDYTILGLRASGRSTSPQ
jgi:hypothetical protein